MTLSTVFLHSTINANCLNKSTGTLKNYLRQFTASAFHHWKFYIPLLRLLWHVRIFLYVLIKKNVQLNLSVENIGMIYYTPANNGNLI